MASGGLNLWIFASWTLLPPSLSYPRSNYVKHSNYRILSLYTPVLREPGIVNNDIETTQQSAIVWLSLLVKLLAYSKCISTFPSFINFSFLEGLLMARNQIIVTPRENIECLILLREFYLQHNRVTLMTNIPYLTSLEEFNIGYNRISPLIIRCVSWLSKSHKLSCEFNHIAALPDVVALLPSLQEFNAEGNRLLTLPGPRLNIKIVLKIRQ